MSAGTEATELQPVRARLLDAGEDLAVALRPLECPERLEFGGTLVERCFD